MQSKMPGDSRRGLHEDRFRAPGSNQQSNKIKETYTMMMKTMMTMDRMSMPASMMGNTPNMMGMPSMNMMMVPRCTMKMEMCSDGMKMMCMSDDAMAVGMLQNLCDMMAGSMMSCCMMNNGMMMACFNMTMGMCKAEMMKNGVCITCTSGDAMCCKMIQECCTCMMSMMKNGCSNCVCLNNMTVCCCTM
jgi:hypothetical protein